MCDIIIPTAFTPNSGEVNDFWQIIGLDMTYPNNVVRIYNRWGNLLYEHISQNGSNPYNSHQWDGNYEGNPLPVGSYFYIIEYDAEDAEKGSAHGSVSIIRN